MYLRVYIPPCLCSSVSIYLRVYISLCVCTSVCMYLRVYVPPCACTSVSMYLSIHTPQRLSTSVSIHLSTHTPQCPCLPLCPCTVDCACKRPKSSLLVLILAPFDVSPLVIDLVLFTMPCCGGGLHAGAASGSSSSSTTMAIAIMTHSFTMQPRVGRRHTAHLSSRRIPRARLTQAPTSTSVS